MVKPTARRVPSPVFGRFPVRLSLVIVMAVASVLAAGVFANTARAVGQTAASSPPDGQVTAASSDTSSSDAPSTSEVSDRPPRMTVADMSYAGAFRLGWSGDGEFRLGYSSGVIGLGENGSSLFVAGRPGALAISEYPLVEPSTATTLEALPMSSVPTQSPASLAGRIPTGNPQNIDRIGGMAFVDGALVVNGYEYYDAPADNTHTTLALTDASNIDGSTVEGWAEMTGTAHAAGWLSPIPMAWRDSLGGTHIAGQSSGMPIISRTSVGPSAFSIDLESTLASVDDAERLLDFDLESPLAADLANDSGGNDLWTFQSRAVYGFVVPGTSTYLTIGSSGGHNSGVSYGIPPYGGPKGYYINDKEDVSPHYWLWDLDDFIQVRAGTLEADQLRPYESGPLQLPFVNMAGDRLDDVGGAAYDPLTGRLYISVVGVDYSQNAYEYTPLILAYSIDGFDPAAGPDTPRLPETELPPADSSNEPSPEALRVQTPELDGSQEPAVAEPGDTTRQEERKQRKPKARRPKQPKPEPTTSEPEQPQQPEPTPAEPVQPEPRLPDPPLPKADKAAMFCPQYLDSPLRRQRERTVRVGPNQDWESILANAKAGTEILLEDGEYRMTRPAVYLPQGNITIRGAGGDRDAVVIRGQGYDVGGEGLMIAGPNVTVADLTMTGMRNHAVSVKPEAGGGAAHVYNVHIYDIGTQHIKGSSGADNVDGVVACSSLGYTDGGAKGDYNGAIDIHRAVNWTIRDNYIYNINGDGTGCEVDTDCGANYVSAPAIYLWNNSRGGVIERNMIVDSFRGIALGLGRDHRGGVIRNNFIYQSSPGDAGIELWTAHDVVVEHNTIILGGDYQGAIEYRESSNVTLRNNLLSAPPWDRGSTSGVIAEGNITDASVADLADPGGPHLHSGSRARGAGVPTGVRHDFDGDDRIDRWDAGADQDNG